MKKIIVGILIMIMVTCGLAACAGQGNESKVESNETVNETLVETSAESEEVTETDDKAAAEHDKAMVAYRQALIEIYDHQTFPDGRTLGFMGTDMSENKFAICDVDRDGREELIVEYTTGCMADMTISIYDYIASIDKITTELIDFPSVTFYDNLVITADSSHNQGYAGEFWPYTYYIYDAANDFYLPEIYVDAWDRSLSEVDAEGNPFPDEADKDGDGIVYYLRSIQEDFSGSPVDWEEYDQWHKTYIGNAVEISFMDLTEKNIRNIQ